MRGSDLQGNLREELREAQGGKSERGQLGKGLGQGMPEQSRPGREGSRAAPPSSSSPSSAPGIVSYHLRPTLSSEVFLPPRAGSGASRSQGNDHAR